MRPRTIHPRDEHVIGSEPPLGSEHNCAQQVENARTCKMVAVSVRARLWLGRRAYPVALLADASLVTLPQTSGVSGTILGIFARKDVLSLLQVGAYQFLCRAL